MEIEVVIENVSSSVSLTKILGLPVIVRTVKAVIAAGCSRVVIVAETPPELEEALKGTSVPLIFVSKRPEPREGRIFFSGDAHYDPDYIRSIINGEAGGKERDLWTQKLDGPNSFKQAERKLFENIRRKTEGWVAPRINKPVSFFITKYLVLTPVTPNQITLVNLLVAATAFFFLVGTDYVSRISGALLMYASSIIDGCDGEVARLKLMTSKAGAWFDTVVDDVSNNLFLLALALGLYASTHDALYFAVGMAALGMSAGATAVIYHQLLTRVSTGNAKDFAPAWQSNARTHGKTWFERFRPLLKRDFFIAVIFIFVVLDLREIVFWMGFAAAGIAFILYSYSLILSLKKANNPHVPP